VLTVGDRVRTALGLAGVVVELVDQPGFNRVMVQLDSSPQIAHSYPPSFVRPEEDQMPEPEPMPNEHHDWEAAHDRLRKRAEEGYPEPWQPDGPDDEIMGVVVAVNAAAPTAYGPSPVVVLETRQGDRRSLWLFHTVLRRQFSRQGVALGEIVLVRYRGKVHPDGGGNPSDDYIVVVDRPLDTREPDWGAIAERYGDDRDEDLFAKPAGGAAAADVSADDEDIPF
jgi:hypothetical protein